MADPISYVPVDYEPDFVDQPPQNIARYEAVDFDPFADQYADRFAASINRNLPRQIPGQDRVIHPQNSYVTEAPVYYGVSPPNIEPLSKYPFDRPPVYMYDPANPERAQSVENPAAPVMEEGPTSRLYGPHPSFINFDSGEAIPTQGR
jgi:hypothetical protein